MIDSKRGRSVALFAIQVSISSLFLAYILQLTPLDQILSTVNRAIPSLVFLAIVLMGLEKYVLAFQLKRITDGQGMNVSAYQIFRINVMTSFYELFLPGTIASGVIRWFKLIQQSNMKISALVAIGFNRLIQTVVLILLGGICWSLDPRAKEEGVAGLFVFFLLMGGIILYALSTNSQFFSDISKRIEKTVSVFMPVSFQRRITSFVNALGNFQRLSFNTKLEIFTLTLGANLLSIGGWVLLTEALMLQVPLVTLLWIRSCIAILVMIPISFAGLGVREGSLMALLFPYGIAMDEALAFSVLLFFMRICWGMIGGLLEACDLFVRR
ncbi:MAG: hypothetical protein NPIRA02_39900 [Nitrospirales bacterium]|nr:MAG: hypothetical protein NPIRA02_39900 [Nitrospirales bacterium]